MFDGAADHHSPMTTGGFVNGVIARAIVIAILLVIGWYGVMTLDIVISQLLGVGI